MRKKPQHAKHNPDRAGDTDTSSFEQLQGAADATSDSRRPQEKLPHERDESARATGNRLDPAAPPSGRQISQAHEDVEEGLIDTDRRGVPNDVPRGGR
jgi:hypothetical protein